MWARRPFVLDTVPKVVPKEASLPAPRRGGVSRLMGGTSALGEGLSPVVLTLPGTESAPGAGLGGPRAHAWGSARRGPSCCLLTPGRVSSPSSRQSKTGKLLEVAVDAAVPELIAMPPDFGHSSHVP